MQKREIRSIGRSDLEYLQGPLDELLVSGDEMKVAFGRVMLEMALVATGIRSGADLGVTEVDGVVTVRLDEGLLGVTELVLTRTPTGGGWLAAALRLADQVGEGGEPAAPASFVAATN